MSSMSSTVVPHPSSRVKSVIMSNNRLMEADFSYMDRTSDSSSNYEPPKKKRVRAKLDHLSPGEKLQRRKMKNRIAAQTARDRKRAKIDHLEEENRKLREENEILKSQLKSGKAVSPGILLPPTVQMADSGISDNNDESVPKDLVTAQSDMNTIDMDLLMVPNQSNIPSSPGSSYTSGVHSSSSMLENQDYLDSVVGETNESSIIEDILQLQSSLFSGNGDEASIESAELINEPQQQVQEASYQSRLVENSAGWTSIQLMLLLMIARVHRMYSWKINCCAIPPEKSHERPKACSNLYDYILQTRCIDFQRAAEAIISNKNNIQKQRLVALEFVYIYLYNSRLINSIPTSLVQNNDGLNKLR